MKTIGEKIVRRREYLHLTQKDLSEKTEISTRTISKYEQDEVTPRRNNLKKIAEVLGISVAYLLNPDIDDETYGLEVAPYTEHVRSVYGNKGASEMQRLFDSVSGWMAGGETPQEDKDKFFRMVTEAYFLTKQDASEAFTPKSKKK